MAPNMRKQSGEMGQENDVQGDAEESGAGGFCIELRVTADGEMSIGVESLEDEAAEDGGATSEDYQPVKSLQEAFRLIRELVAHGGNKEDMQAGANEMDSGYK